MNPSVNEPGEQATDKLLFQYLEGALTDKQTSTLEARLAADPALRGELELWRTAFVVPEDYDYDTAALEKRLLKEPAPPAGPPVVRWGVGLVLVAALFLSAPLLTERPPAGKTPRPAAGETGELSRATPGTKPPVRIPVQVPQPVLAAPDHGSAERAVPARPLPRVRREDRAEAATPAPAPMAAVDRLEPLGALRAVPVPDGTGLGSVKEQPVRKVKVAAPGTLSRKQQRAVARMKRRAIQQRKANEFLKGNVPYVVPLDPNSF